MKIIHRLGKRAVKKAGEGSFLLTDRAGNFFSLGSPQNITHMQGLFHLTSEWKMYKSVENIYPDKEISEVENFFEGAIRRYGSSEEEFRLTSTALIYEMRGYDGWVNLDLDFREMYDFDEEGRFYEVDKEDDIVIVYYKKHDKYLAIKGVDGYEVVGNWQYQHYNYDESRNSKANFYVYKALRIKCEDSLKLFLSFSDSKDEAIRYAKSASVNEEKLKGVVKHRLDKICNHKDINVNTVFNALESLRTVTNEGEGVFAGLPWFYQFWSRDELISLKAFMLQGEYDFVKKKLMDYLELIDDNGRIPNRFPDSKLGSADGIGWLFKRVYDFLTILDSEGKLGEYFSHAYLEEIKHKLHFCIEEHMALYTQNHAIVNDSGETWMDTTSGKDDARAGACIEINALFLGFFRLMKLLCKHLNLTYYGYGSLEKMLSERVKKLFYHKGMLLDRLGDSTIRPNVFIAYYAYPDLLKKREWRVVFDRTIKRLWLDWGGFTTIEKDHPLYHEKYSGEGDESYHRGDSWFWINNLAAVCMADLDKDYYDYHIDHLHKVAEKEMLFSGIIGHCSELSSAKSLRSEGCLAQAWSAAMLIEMYNSLDLL